MSYSTKQQQAVLQCLEQGVKSPHRSGPGRTTAAQRKCPWDWPRYTGSWKNWKQAGRIHKIRTEEGAFYQICSSRTANGHRDCFLLQL